jgi:hypothetical protein
LAELRHGNQHERLNLNGRKELKDKHFQTSWLEAFGEPQPNNKHDLFCFFDFDCAVALVHNSQRVVGNGLFDLTALFLACLHKYETYLT